MKVILLSIIFALTSSALHAGKSVDVTLRKSSDFDSRGNQVWTGTNIFQSIHLWPLSTAKQTREFTVSARAPKSVVFDLRCYCNITGGSYYTFEVWENSITSGLWDKNKWQVKYELLLPNGKWGDVTDRILNWRKYNPGVKGFILGAYDYKKFKQLRLTITPTARVKKGDRIEIVNACLDRGTNDTDHVYTKVSVTD